jgi:exosortase/archaeosortase family protein
MQPKSIYLTFMIILIIYIPYLLLIYDEIQHQQLAQQANRLLSVPLVLIGSLSLMINSYRFYGSNEHIISSPAQAQTAQAQTSPTFTPPLLLYFSLIAQLISIYLIKAQVYERIAITTGPSAKDWYLLTLYCLSLTATHHQLLTTILPNLLTDHALKTRLNQLLMLNLFSLPLEPSLRHFDPNFQQLGADGAVYLLNILDKIFDLGLNLRYSDQFTFYSDRFYLIINESCSGVNLLLSSGMFVFLLAVLMGISMRGTIYLFLLAIPLSMFFNMTRIALIFWLGHDQGVAVAMGPWHERSAYLSTFFLTLVLMWIGQSRWLSEENRV